VLLCYITDRTQFAGDETTRRERLLNKISEAARSGVDYIQLREKDLSGRELESLAQAALARVLSADSPTKLLINSRTDIAIAVGAHGIHLRSQDLSPKDVREIYRECGMDTPAREKPGVPVIGVSCHTVAEVAHAALSGATFAVLGPIFEKSYAPDTPALGLKELRKACHYKIPVFPLGGVTMQNAQSCLKAGAAGIAGIRLFQQNNIVEVIRRLQVC
jgi:thiamine-phosphate pyrophosphorylase